MSGKNSNRWHCGIPTMFILWLLLPLALLQRQGTAGSNVPVNPSRTPSSQVEETCFGTGMAFDPAFHCYPPTSVYAAHGYGPALLAGPEMIQTIKQSC
jgi:hypothetical protein